MSQFIDRNGTDLNKKRLKVVQVVRDPSTDEISELYVEEFRNDSAGLIIEGTPLNADNLNSIIRSMMNSGENTQNNKTNAQKLREVVDNLSINMYISDDFTLPSNGEYGTGITWEVKNGNSIEIYNYTATVIRGDINAEVTLLATVSIAGETPIEKEFNVIVLAREKTPEERVLADINAIEIPDCVIEDFELPTSGDNGTTISWYIAFENEIDDAIVIEGSTAKVTRRSYDQEVTLIATVKCTGALQQKDFIVTVAKVVNNTTGVTFSPDIFDNVWNQESGVLKTTQFTIFSSDTTPLYAIVENPASHSIDVEVTTNSSRRIVVTVSEKSGLNQIRDHSPMDYTFYVHIYLDNDREAFVGTLTGNVTYYFLSSN